MPEDTLIATNAEQDVDLAPMPTPAGRTRLTNQQILLGSHRDPLQEITTYADDGWEEFIREWAESLPGVYTDVRRASGSGDQGRDVVAHVHALNTGGPWDNYQCKRYDHPLMPSDIWPELAKLCYYTHKKRYTIPRNYYFVAPRGIGPTVLTLLEQPALLRNGLFEAWQKSGFLHIKQHDIPLLGDLETYVTAFDFGIIRDLPPSKIIEQHRATRHYAARFGGGLVRQPPHAVDVPAAIAATEARYVEQLLQAYADHLASPITNPSVLENHPELHGHFHRQRKHFYLAEALRNFTRDNLPEEGCYERLQDEIYDGVIDVAASTHSDGYERVKKTIQAARNLQIDSHPLRECLVTNHRSGICHQLANDDRLRWVP